MDWLNIHTATLDSEDFLGCEPVDQATWLKLMRYCIGQENGGRVENCEDWGDRRWQQVIRITRQESRRSCPLWSWDGDTLVVAFYPTEKQEEVQAKREAARSNGRRGGRPKITQEKPTLVILDNPGETNIGYPQEPTLAKCPKAEGNGREGEGNGREVAAAAATREDSLVASAPPPAPALFDGIEPIPTKPSPVIRSWQDWKFGKRLGMNRDGSREVDWISAYERLGWDELTKGYEYFFKKLTNQTHVVWANQIIERITDE